MKYTIETHDVKPVVNMRKAKANSYKHCLEMIDKLITESEGLDGKN